MSSVCSRNPNYCYISAMLIPDQGEDVIKLLRASGACAQKKTHQKTPSEYPMLLE